MSRIAMLRDAAKSYRSVIIDGVTVEAFFARRIVDLYDGVSANNRRKFEELSADKLIEVAIRVMNKDRMPKA